MPNRAEALNPFLFQSETISYPLRMGNQWSEEEWSIVKTLTYFDIFKYPLKKEEILAYSSHPFSNGIETSLQSLTAAEIISFFEGYYFLGKETTKVEDRKNRNQWAQNYMPKAIQVSRWIYALPFVECVCISGSLSKMDMRPKGDIDYFIIAKKNRVWILRFIFSLLIKPLTLLGGRNRYLCPNYIIDIRNLEIRDKNYYTAIEISTLMPVIGEKCYGSFIEANRWYSDFLPNHEPKKTMVSHKKRNILFIWDSLLFTWINRAIYATYKAHYKRKFVASGKFTVEDFELKFNLLESKNHVNGYRNRILTLFDEKLKQWEPKAPSL